VQVFHSLGYLIAPILAGIVVGEVVGFEAFGLAWMFLGLGFAFFLFLLYMVKYNPATPKPQESMCQAINLQKEVYLWLAASNILRPVLIITVILSIYDSFFWTLGPLIAQTFDGPSYLQGLFLAAYEVPILGVGWCIGSVTKKFGKKRTAFFSLLFGSLLLAPIELLKNPALIISLVFLSSLFISMATPSINGAFTDYIAEAPKAEKEIVGINDFAGNIGYILGPILAGVLAQTFNNGEAFAILAGIGMIIAVFLLRSTPKSIGVRSLDAAAEA